MARIPQNLITDTFDSTNDVIHSIRKGEYILVVGSDVILTEEGNIGAHGNVTRYVIENIVESYKEGIYDNLDRRASSNNLGMLSHIKDRDKREIKPYDTFSEFVIYNELDVDTVRKWVNIEIGRVLNPELNEVNPDLYGLLQTKAFRLVICTTFDPYIEMMMEKIWGKGNFKVLDIYSDSDSGEFDMSDRQLRGDEYGDITPTLYYAFGHPDKLSTRRKVALDDNDVMECITKWLSNKAPENLLSYINGIPQIIAPKRILAVGCNMKDWCFRFFWYALRNKSKEQLKNGDIALLLNSESDSDRSLYSYMYNTLRIKIEKNGREYLRELMDKYNRLTSGENAFEGRSPGGVFISYASEDFAVADRLFRKLREAGLKVWLDNRKLHGGDKYDKRIRDAIEKSSVFIPILSSTVAEHLEKGDGRRYFQDEWDLACGPNAETYIIPLILGRYDEKSEYHKSLHDKITKGTVFKWDERPIKELITQINTLTR